ncbi:hypothetical protein IFM89_004835 [Coptis chinensis]|uniref:Protein SAR DEFICIENT 1 n=1 Tax=Coptis chinensis TaxID=261450 RepID=A0A835H2X1_9MAGN|nr:hypothetical protein IFM89_004835 [Coptis chinensis]
MSPKRLLAESSEDTNEAESSLRKRTRPSFAAVIGEAMMVKSLQSLCSALEPMLRRVATSTSNPSTRTFEAGAMLHQKLSLPVFTASKVEDEEKTPLQLTIADVQGNHRLPTRFSYPIKVEIVVLDGDFVPGDCENWTSEYFDSKIVRERTGRRPLITGDVVVTMRDGVASIGDLTFTDNSSWIRSRTFRLGARVAPESTYNGVRIREAITEAFVVRDHRGELYKKHHPPSLSDEVWRLEKIGKEGVFHRKLNAENVNSVQDFLKLWVVDPVRLRSILGVGMSDRIFELTIKHAKECVLGNKHYILRGSCYTIFLNSICQVERILVNGMQYPTYEVIGAQRAHVEKLVRDAYGHWNSLEEVDRFVKENALLPPGDSVAMAHYHGRRCS